MGKEPEEIVRYRSESDVEEEEKIEEIAFLENREFIQEKNSVSLARKVCTGMKTNRRVFLPAHRPVKEECNLETRRAAWMREWNEYREKNCDTKGSQEQHQLSAEERQGKVSLMKRVAAGELYVGQSDKGKGLVVMTTDLYHQMSVVHTKEDQKISWRELQDTQREIRANSRALAKIFQLGHGPSDRNKTRCYDNISSWAGNPPIMRCQAKTHKPVGPTGIPMARPIVGAAHGLTTAMGSVI